MTPYRYAEAVTPNDNADNILNDTSASCRCRGIMVGVSGTLSFINGSGGVSQITNLVVGQIYPISTKRILAAGTSATGIIALW